ncbi:hypothetical protein Q5424_24870 [Conexibacter sp. JD483]|uniref:hypothetical protein n=1 Tax=unclassified Conexibacter TaxID=2627773 RepID=UPI00272028C1|nr:MULTISPECIES: hypothetical protein [unclassified Conexibacter]MDO8189300.1 hypothetical protein [Conexibacter sp. CPCC 205706]MDO8201756.1 hypothetical protein [Conexibacter sp. CPCC 205762]MDR9372354.1 hypothetical protein [Conexibacter sp. JD483]
MRDTNETTGRARRRVPLAAALLVSLLAAIITTAAAAPARAVELGISDSNATTLAERWWDGLNVKRIRVVLPYDVALESVGPAGARRREEFDQLRAAAPAKGVSLMVSFGPSADLRAPSGDALAPTLQQFAEGFAAFRTAYPDITEIAPWNEPNNPDGRTYPLASDPALAASYFLQVQATCAGCTVIAGDFAGISGDDAYFNAYAAALNGAIPAVWAFHAHSDVNSFQQPNGPDSARVARYYLGKLQGPYANARIWIDEVGARYRDASGQLWGDDSQSAATQFLLGLGTLDPRIDRIYYYNFSNQCTTAGRCAIQDRGLVSPAPMDGSPLDYDTPDRPRSAYNVYAAGGPVIQPAQLVPPVVTIDTLPQAASVRVRTPLLGGAAAVGGRAATTLSLQIFSGVSGTQSSTPLQTLTATVGPDGRWSVRPTALADGAYTARATQVGNPSSSGVSQDLAFSIDTVRPTVRVATAPPAQTGARTATVNLTPSDAGSTFQCKLDSARWAPCTFPLQLTGVRLGAHALQARATDPAGNVQRRPTVVSWRVVSLQTALLPRVASLSDAVRDGLPLSTSCADSCRIDARVYVPRSEAASVGLTGRGLSKNDPARPKGDYLVVGGASAKRSRAGAAELALRLRSGSAARLGRTRQVTVRVGFTLTPKGSKPTAVSRTVVLTRGGAVRLLATQGYPVTVACASSCAARATLYAPAALAKALRLSTLSGSGRLGLPRGRYAKLGERVVRLARGGGYDVSIEPALPRAARTRLARQGVVAVRGVARTRLVGTDPRLVGWPLRLPR